MRKFAVILGITAIVVSLSTNVLLAVEGTSTSYTYRSDFGAAELADYVGIPEEKVLNVNSSASQCVVEIERPIRVDKNQTFDQDGNLIEEEIIEIAELETWQLDRLHEFMNQSACGRLFKKSIR